MAWNVGYSQTLECYKSRICYENLTETYICDMYENEKLCIVMKTVRVLVKNEQPPTVLILEKKWIIFVDTVMLKNMLGIFLSIDICTSHRVSSKNFDLNIWADTCNLTLSVIYGPTVLQILQVPTVPVVCFLVYYKKTNF